VGGRDAAPASSDDLRQLRGFYGYLESAVFLPFASACRIHFCSVSEQPMPNFCATAPIAARSDGYSGHHEHRALTQLRGIVC
jgi:hypothetical protein